MKGWRGEVVTESSTRYSTAFFLNNIFLNRNSESSTRFGEIRNLARCRHGPCRNKGFRHGRRRKILSACRQRRRQAWPTPFGSARAERGRFGSARAETFQVKRRAPGSAFFFFLLSPELLPLSPLSLFFRFPEKDHRFLPQKIPKNPQTQEIEMRRVGASPIY